MTPILENKVNEYIVTASDENQRLDNLLIKLLKDIPKSYIYRIIRQGEVRINKKRAKPDNKVAINDIIRIPPINYLSTTTKHNKYIPKEVFITLYEDEYYLIINKPAKIACHGGSGIDYGVIEQMRTTRTNLKFLELAHRLDKDTSGILILAKKRLALTKIQEIIKNRQIKKCYIALVFGEIRQNKITIKLPLYKYTTKNGERRVRVEHNQGLYAETTITLIKQLDKFALVKANIKTGRTHQIRVHMQSIHHPIVLDDKYGLDDINKTALQLGLNRMFLHASEIEFIHPFTNQIINIQSKIPQELENFIKKL
jgi:23S rRNA pseudouridine955/2504/2580 synthase